MLNCASDSQAHRPRPIEVLGHLTLSSQPGSPNMPTEARHHLLSGSGRISVDGWGAEETAGIFSTKHAAYLRSSSWHSGACSAQDDKAVCLLLRTKRLRWPWRR